MIAHHAIREDLESGKPRVLAHHDPQPVLLEISQKQLTADHAGDDMIHANAALNFDSSLSHNIGLRDEN